MAVGDTFRRGELVTVHYTPEGHKDDQEPGHKCNGKVARVRCVPTKPNGKGLMLYLVDVDGLGEWYFSDTCLERVENVQEQS